MLQRAHTRSAVLALLLAAGCAAFGTSQPVQVFVDPELSSAASSEQLGEMARQQIAQARALRGPEGARCEIDFDRDRVAFRGVQNADSKGYALSETELHARKARGRVDVTLVPTPGGGSSTPTCSLVGYEVGDTIDADEALEIGRLVSVLAALGVQVPSEYRSGKGKGGVLIVANDTISYDNGDRYEGRSVAGMPLGEGVLYFAAGGRYEGLFAKGRPAGLGKLVTKAGRILEGDLVDGNLQGTGTETLPNGTVFSGNFENGVRHGQFTARRSDGSDSVQRWKHGKLVYEGPGPQTLARLAEAPICSLSSTAWVYVSGGCANGLAEGKGEAAPADPADRRLVSGRFEAGEFVEGQLRSIEGEILEGAWRHYRLDLQGREIVADEIVYDGGWSNGRRHGKGICLFDGVMEACEYETGARMDAVHRARVAAKQESVRQRHCDTAMPALERQDEQLREMAKHPLCRIAMESREHESAGDTDCVGDDTCSIAALSGSDLVAVGACIDAENEKLTKHLEQAGGYLRTILDNACAHRNDLLAGSQRRDRLASSVREQLSDLEQVHGRAMESLERRDDSPSAANALPTRPRGSPATAARARNARPTP
ncbi:MAG: hypothetical protein E2O69_00165 [Deltaproteobacteria bacterium]|nr:MAG: hypothetical protein E2O69_00165 [Deltaproteobacteria bacterium]